MRNWTVFGASKQPPIIGILNAANAGRMRRKWPHLDQLGKIDDIELTLRVSHKQQGAFLVEFDACEPIIGEEAIGEADLADNLVVV